MIPCESDSDSARITITSTLKLILREERPRTRSGESGAKIWDQVDSIRETGVSVRSSNQLLRTCSDCIPSGHNNGPGINTSCVHCNNRRHRSWIASRKSAALQQLASKSTAKYAVFHDSSNNCTIVSTWASHRAENLREQRDTPICPREPPPFRIFLADQWLVGVGCSDVRGSSIAAATRSNVGCRGCAPL